MKANRSILFVEDDAVVLTTYRNLLQREGYKIESAVDGLEALKALSQATPDLIVLDLMLPKFDGADVLKFIRADPRLKTIPIIIFSNAQVTDFTEDAITKHLRKTDCTPSILLQTIQNMLDGTAGDAAGKADYSPTVKLHMAGDKSAPAASNDKAEAASPSDETPAPKERSGALKDASADIAKLRELCLAYIKAPTSAAKLEPLSRSVQALNAAAAKAGYARIALLTKAFDMLLAKIASKPARVTPSILQTLAEAADSLSILLKSDEAGSGETALRSKVLAVDDDTVCNHVIVNTLKRANLDITSVEDPFEGLKLLQNNRYDLVLLDIDMPKLTGFEVCEKLRALPQYKTTPVIFVTAHSNFGNRTQGVLSGGNYFITKPVDPLELALKVTIHLFKAQAQHSGAAQTEVKSAAKPEPKPELKPEPKPEVKPRAASTPEPPAKPPVPAPTSQPTNGNGPAAAKPRAAEPASVAPPKPAPPPLKPAPPPPPPPKAAPPPPVKAAPPPPPKPVPPLPKLAPPVLKTAPSVELSPTRSIKPKTTVPELTISSAPAISVPTLATSVKPRAAGISKVLPPPSSAPSLNETGTLNVNRLAGSRNRNSIMNNEQDEAFEKVVVAVVRIIFGDDNLTEMNVRLVRIALERYNVHEVINSPVAA
ncbi:MAG TPA: response regulator [Candidatus Acidoferrum sp.]|nr:response regulator [Candidatus Acidoferrum sp.]